TLAQAPPAGAEAVRLVVSVVERKCWVQATADGVKLFEGKLLGGEVRTFEAKDDLKILFGDLGAVRLELNGRDLGTPGRPGQVGTLTFTPSTGSQQG
ncbi:MAG: DUF4115 domain-containing protein, partial [Actinomycetota bacterium]